METMNENVIEWIRGDQRAAVTSPANTRMANKLLRLAADHPEDVDIIVNHDGSVFGHVPAKWIKMIPSKAVSEDQREKAREWMKQLRSEMSRTAVPN